MSSCVFGNILRVSSFASDVYNFIMHLSSYVVCLGILWVSFVFKENSAKFWVIRANSLV